MKPIQTPSPQTAPRTALLPSAARPSAVLLFLLCATVGASAQSRLRPEEVVNLSLEPAQVKAQSRATVQTTLVATIASGYHVNSSKPLEDYLIPSRVTVSSDQFELEEASFPEGELKSFEFSEEKLSVYEGILRVSVRLRARKGIEPGTYSVRLTFHYQACNERICLRPATRETTLTVNLR